MATGFETEAGGLSAAAPTGTCRMEANSGASAHVIAYTDPDQRGGVAIDEPLQRLVELG